MRVRASGCERDLMQAALRCFVRRVPLQHRPKHLHHNRSTPMHRMVNRTHLLMHPPPSEAAARRTVMY
jgi:hypothetical protein